MWTKIFRGNPDTGVVFLVELIMGYGKEGSGEVGNNNLLLTPPPERFFLFSCYGCLEFFWKFFILSGFLSRNKEWLNVMLFPVAFHIFLFLKNLNTLFDDLEFKKVII